MDVTDPTNPVANGEVYSPDGQYAITVQDDLIYVVRSSGSYNSFVIIQVLPGSIKYLGDLQLQKIARMSM